MPIKTFSPFTPSRRFMSVVTREEITKQRPEKSLVESKKRTGGRTSTGRVSSRFIGGGAQEGVPHHRFQARQVRNSGDGGGD